MAQELAEYAGPGHSSRLDEGMTLMCAAQAMLLIMGPHQRGGVQLEMQKSRTKTHDYRHETCVLPGEWSHRSALRALLSEGLSAMTSYSWGLTRISVTFAGYMPEQGNIEARGWR